MPLNDNQFDDALNRRRPVNNGVTLVVKSPMFDPYGEDWTEQYFDGDGELADRIEKQVHQIIQSETGCKYVFNDDAEEFTYSCPSMEASKMLLRMLETAASERPDDQTDLFMALMANDMTYEYE